MDFSALRRYLALPPRTRPADVRSDALVNNDLGAVHLLDYILQTRVNRRTRRGLGTVTSEYRKREKDREAWYPQLEQWVWNLYRLSLVRTSNGLRPPCKTYAFLLWWPSSLYSVISYNR